MFHMTTKIYRNIKRSVLAHYLSPQGVKCATPPHKTCARTFVYGLGCIFLICCPNLMFNTSICMDVDGELIKRQNITLQINFHCLVDLQIIFFDPSKSKICIFLKTLCGNPHFLLHKWNQHTNFPVI